MVTFALAYLAERRQRAEAKKAEEASAARRVSCFWGQFLRAKPSEAAESFVLIKTLETMVAADPQPGFATRPNLGNAEVHFLCVCVCVPF